MTRTTRGAGGPASGFGRDFLRLALLVAQRDYLRTIRRRGYVFGTLLLPAGIAIIMSISSAFSFSAGMVDPSSIRLVVVNESGLTLVNDPPVVPDLLVVTRDEAAALIEAGETDRAYVVPSGFPSERTIMRLESERTGLPLGSLEANALEGDLLSALLRMSVLREAGLSPAAARDATAPIPVVSTTPTGEPVSEMASAASFIVPFVFTLLFVMSIFITSGYLLQSVTEEKENRVVEIVLSSVPALPLMAGKILGLGAAGLTQVLAWVATALLAVVALGSGLLPVSNLPIDPVMIALAIVYFVLGYLAFGAIFAAIGALAPGNREAQQYSGFFGFFAVIPLVMSGLFLADPGGIVVVALALFPLTAPATMLQVIALSDSPPLPLIAGSILSLVVFVALATLVCARIFRATVLLYGARPSLRQLAGAVRSGS
jgi:ABC-2 type transport system permease protein